MKNIRKILYLALVSVFIPIAGCDYGDENTDPTAQAGVAVQFILPAALTQAAFNVGASPARMAGLLMQHYSGFDAQQVAFENYVINENSVANYWNFGAYGGVMKDASVLIEQGTAESKPHYSGIGKILMAHALGNLTSVFGDVPWTEALKGTANLKPAYDSQESVYAAVQTLLDQGIAELGQTQVDPVLNDFIHGGDVAKWVATAHALKARYYMHLTKRSATAAASALTEIGLAFTSTADQPDFVFEDNANGANPYAQFGVQRPKTIIINSGFQAKLAAKADPREGLITVNDGSEYIFQGNAGLFWSQNNSPLPLISYTELKFIEAEALVRTGGAGANAALQAAVAANMAYVGVDGTAYLAAMTDITGLAEAAAIEAIMNEAYVALYGQGEVEIWSSYRRTGFPVLTPNPNGVNALNPSGAIPRRMIYPQTERLTNPVNLSAAQAAQSGGLLDVPVWAFQ